MIIVEGANAPSKIHYSLLEATEEANRLAKKEFLRMVTIVEIIARLKAEPIIKNYGCSPPPHKKEE